MPDIESEQLPVARSPNASAVTEAVDESRLGATISSVWQRVPGWLTSLEGPRKLAVNGLVIVATLLGIGVVVKAALKQVYVIDTISVPKDLEAQGYTPATVGQHIIDMVTEINHRAAIIKHVGAYAIWQGIEFDAEAVSSGQSQAVSSAPGRDQSHSGGPSDGRFALTFDDASTKYNVSVGGVSLATVIVYIRELFGQADTKISGEITVANPPVTGTLDKDEKPAPTKFSIRLRINDKGIVPYKGQPTDKLETQFEQAALKLVERFDPLIAAYYSYSKQDYENALRIVHAYQVDQAKNDEDWLLNLRGLIAHAQRHYDEAIAHFTRLKEAYPQFFLGRYNHGFVLIDKGLAEQSVEVAHGLFQQALAVVLEGVRIEEATDKSSRGASVGYATAGRALRYMGRRDAAKYDEALQYFDRSILADPLFTYAYKSQGKIYQERHPPDAEKAIAKYQLAKEIDPSPANFTALGRILRAFNRHAEALPMLQRAAELKPSGYTYTDWGNTARDLGRADEARKLFERAIAVDPKVSNGYNQLGLMQLDEQKWDSAAEAFAKAADLSPQWANYQYNLGRAHRGAGRFDQAIAAFKNAIALNQKHAWSYAQLAGTLVEADRQAAGNVRDETARAAEEKLKQAIEILPSNGAVLKMVGQGYQLLDRPQQAIDFYRRAIAADGKANAGLRKDIERLGGTVGKL